MREFLPQHFADTFALPKCRYPFISIKLYDTSVVASDALIVLALETGIKPSGPLLVKPPNTALFICR